MAYVKNPVPLVSGFGIALGFKKVGTPEAVGSLHLRQRVGHRLQHVDEVGAFRIILGKVFQNARDAGNHPARCRGPKIVSLPLWSRYMRPAWLLKRNIWLSQYIVFIVAKYFLSPLRRRGGQIREAP